MAVFVYVLHRCCQNEKEGLGKILGRAVISYLVALGIYVAALVVLGDNPLTNGNGTSDAGSSSLLGRIVNNYKTYLSYLSSDYSIVWKVFFVVVLIVSLLLFIRSNQGFRGILRILVPILLVLLCALLSFGIYPVLGSDSSFSPRSMYGFGVFVSLLCLNIADQWEQRARENVLLDVSCLFVCCLSWCCIVFAASFGNALYEQNYYVEERMQALVDDLKDCEQLNSGETIEVQVTGTVGYAPVLTNGTNGGEVERRADNPFADLIGDSRQDWNLLARIIPSYLGDSSFVFTDFVLYYYYDLPITRAETDLSELDLPVLCDNVYETIYGDETHLLVKLKNYDLELSMP